MWRPRVEVPQFTRCCFCLPLRYGLLAMAYIKLAISSLFALMITTQLIYMRYYSKLKFIILPTLVDILIYLDIIFTIVFIVAGHRKYRRGIQIYFYYSITITVIFFVGSMAVMIVMLAEHIEYLRYAWVFIAQDILISLSVTLVQIYMLLLLRSELLKLSNPSNFRFVNNVEEQAPPPDKSDGDAILREEREDTASRNEDDGFAYTY